MKRTRTLDDWLWIVGCTCFVSGVAAFCVGEAWPQAPLMSWQGAYVLGIGLAAGGNIYRLTGR